MGTWCYRLHLNGKPVQRVEQAIPANGSTGSEYLAVLHTPGHTSAFLEVSVSLGHQEMSLLLWMGPAPQKSNEGWKSSSKPRHHSGARRRVYSLLTETQHPAGQSVLFLGCQCSQIQENTHKTSSKPLPLCSDRDFRSHGLTRRQNKKKENPPACQFCYATLGLPEKCYWFCRP